MHHSALKHIYCSKKPAETVRIQNFLEEISDFSLDFKHISGKHMFVSFSSDNQDEEAIPYLMDTSCMDNISYMSDLDNMCNFN